MSTNRYSIREWCYIEGPDVPWKSFDCYARTSTGSTLSRYNPVTKKIDTLMVNEFNLCEQRPRLDAFGTWNIDDSLTNIAYITFSLRTGEVAMTKFTDASIVHLMNKFVRSSDMIKNNTPHIDVVMSKRNQRYAYESQLDRMIAIGSWQDIKNRKNLKTVKISTYKQFADLTDDAWLFMPYETMDQVITRLKLIKMEHGQTLTERGELATEQAVRNNLAVLQTELNLRHHDTVSELLNSIASKSDPVTLDGSLIYNHKYVSLLDKLESGTYLYMNGNRVYNVVYVLLFNKVLTLPYAKYEVNIDQLMIKYADGNYEDAYMLEATFGNYWVRINPGQILTIGDTAGQPKMRIGNDQVFGFSTANGDPRKIYQFMRRSYYKNDFINSGSCSWRSSCRVMPLFCIELM